MEYLIIVCLQVLCLEWKKQSEQHVLVDRLAQRGFDLVARLREDLVLVRRGSEYATGLATTTLPQGTRYLHPAFSSYWAVVVAICHINPLHLRFPTALPNNP